LPALAVYLGEEKKTTEKGKIENRIVFGNCFGQLPILIEELPQW
jgi:hypothetical protein